MKKIAGSPRELILSWEDLAERIRQFHWENHTASELRLELQRCIRDHGDLAKAYSILKEIIKRITGLTLFDSQLAAAYSMQKGRVAELPTGEGKTLSAVVAAVCFALLCRGNRFIFWCSMTTWPAGISRPTGRFMRLAG